jgi:hypothetical protein
MLGEKPFQVCHVIAFEIIDGGFPFFGNALTVGLTPEMGSLYRSSVK